MDKLIKHIIYSLYPLIEAYSPKVMQQLMDKFKNEIEDFEIEDVTDEQIETYIKRFDQIKNSPKIKEKDLFNYTLPDLIRLITSSPLKGDEKPIGAPEDIVYTDDELEIYDASNEDRCIALKSHDPSGRQESWCIGRGSFASHRFNERRGYPSYYYFIDVEKFDRVAGDTGNRDFADSFFVISVNNRGKYVYTDRTNSPNYSSDSEWSEIESRFPILRGKNLKDKIRYIPLSDEEKLNQKYKNTSAPIRDFRKFSFNLKKQYLVARKDQDRLFRDMDQDEFAGKILPQYKELMDFVSVTPGIINTMVLLKNLENYKNNNVKSIVSNIREGDLGLDVLEPDVLPWEVRKLLVKFNKKAFEGRFSRSISSDKYDFYVSKDQKYIFLLSMDSPSPYDTEKSSAPMKLQAWSEFDRFQNVKITPRTEKYIEDLDLSKYPPAPILSMVTKGELKVELVKDQLEKIKKGETKKISYKKVGEKDYFANFQDLSSFTIEKGRIKALDFNSDEVQEVFAEEAAKGAIQVLTIKQNLPETIDINQFKSTLNNLSIEDRTIQDPENEEKSSIVFVDEEGINLIYSNPDNISTPRLFSTRWKNNKVIDTYGNTTPSNETYQKYFEYLRNTNQFFSDNIMMEYILGNSRYWGVSKAKLRWAANNPPLSPDSAYVVILSEDGEALVINKAEPRNSKKVSNKSGKLIKLNLPISKAIELAGDAITATPARRGRTAGTTTVDRNAPLPELQGDTVQSTLEAIGLSWNSFPDKLKRKLHFNVIARSPYQNRGATRRKNMLGYAATIRNYYTAGDIEGRQRNAIYIIQIGAAVFASIVMQPGNNHYVVTTNNVIKLSSPSQLRDKLRELDILTEIKKFIIKEYLYQKNNNMKKKDIKKLVKEIVKEVISENEPQQAPDTETPERETIPYTPPKPGEKKRRRRIGNPNADPNPKAVYETEKEILNRIAKRFNKLKDD